jgi:hypothetical protein
MHPFRTFPVALAAALLAGATGCSSATPTPAAPDAPAEAAGAPVTRDSAVLSARQDAYYRYGEVAGGGVDVQRSGGFWIIELRRAQGGGLRYAISANDGSIRQRSTFQ